MGQERNEIFQVGPHSCVRAHVGGPGPCDPTLVTTLASLSLVYMLVRILGNQSLSPNGPTLKLGGILVVLWSSFLRWFLFFPYYPLMEPLLDWGRVPSLI